MELTMISEGDMIKIILKILLYRRKLDAFYKQVGDLCAAKYLLKNN